MADYKPKAIISLKSKGTTATVEVKTMPARDSASQQNNPKKTGSLDQQRAAYAWEKVQGCNSDYCNLAKAAPALIMTNGLMQTLAYYQEKQEKSKNHHAALSKHLREWLVERRIIEQSDFSTVMTSLQTADAARFRQATEETFALLRWIRQFAAAKIGG